MSDLPAAPPPLKIGMLIYPGVTLLDLSGPQTALAHHGETFIVAKSLDPIVSDSGIIVTPTTTFADCPDHLDVLFAPGGYGTYDAMEDAATLEFFRESGRTARYITSVCSGSLILAAAGLLDGYKATSHWACYDILRAFGVEVLAERVVTDRNRITGGGVTAGIDFGLTILAELRGELVARTTQLVMEYDPAPPFASGSPAAAGPELTSAVSGMMAELTERGLDIANAIARRSKPAADRQEELSHAASN